MKPASPLQNKPLTDLGCAAAILGIGLLALVLLIVCTPPRPPGAPRPGAYAPGRHGSPFPKSKPKKRKPKPPPPKKDGFTAREWERKGADAFLKRQDYAQAEKAFSNVIALTPRSSRAYRNRAVARLYRENRDGARADFDKALGLDERNHEAYAGRGTMNLQDGKLDDAETDARRGLKQAPRNAALHDLLGQVLFAQGKPDAALAALNEAIKLNERLTQAWRNRGLVYLKRNQLDKARNDFEKALELAPKNAHIRLCLVDLHLRAADPEAAAAAASKAISLAPEEPQCWLAAAAAAVALDDQETYRKAAAKLRELHPQAEQRIAQAQRIGQAQRELRRGRELGEGDLKDPALLVARARYRTSQKRWEEAEQDFRNALEASPALGPRGVYAALADLAEKREAWRSRLDWFQRWADTAPDSPEANNAYAWELLESKDKDLRDPHRALPLARKADALVQHQNPAILDTLALALYRTGAVEAAVATQRKAIKLLPEGLSPAQRAEYQGRLEEFLAAPRGEPAE